MTYDNNLTYSSLFEELATPPELTKYKRTQTSKFFKEIYYYYIKGGFYNILTSKILDIFSLFFIGIFIIITFIFLDWGNIILCGKDTNIKDCGDIREYLKIENFYGPNFFQVLILIFVLSIFFYTIYKFTKLYNDCINYYNIDRYYVDTLKIPRQYLHSKSWEDIILSISNTNNNLPIDDIANIILIEENFFISFIDNNLFNVSNKYFTKQLEYSIYYGINPISLINKDFTYIKNRLICVGILNIFLSPFILLYIIIFFIFNNIDELYINKKVLGSRRYSNYFKWKIRQYNELDHYFENRVNMSMKYANEYIKHFPSIMMENIAKFIAFISGAFIVLFLVFSILDENILLYVKFGNRSLIFYTGIIASISSISRSFIREPENTVYNPNGVMDKIGKYTLYYPEIWKDNAHTFVVKNEFLGFYNYILVNFLYEIRGIITTPYLLIFDIPKQARIIEEFMKRNVVYKKNIGNICLWSDFKNKNNRNEKLASSILSFSENYLSWEK
jgi:autophagy-related protein 9